MTQITCAVCSETEEYDDDGTTLECMPDGVLVSPGEWVCGDCMVDNEGETLPQYR